MRDRGFETQGATHFCLECVEVYVNLGWKTRMALQHSACEQEQHMRGMTPCEMQFALAKVSDFMLLTAQMDRELLYMTQQAAPHAACCNYITSWQVKAYLPSLLLPGLILLSPLALHHAS